jgi:hypothetical protein
MKVFIGGVSVALLIGLSWYLFIRQPDITAQFKIHTYPETVIETMEVWHKTHSGSEITWLPGSFEVLQSIKVDGHDYRIKWQFESRNDTSTFVKALAWEPEHQIANRLMMPFGGVAIKEDLRFIASDFYDKLKEHLSKIRVKIDGETRYDSAFCVYIPLKTTQLGKARGMMANYSFIANFIVENEFLHQFSP